MTRFIWVTCVLAVANACRDAPSREQKLPNGVLAETKYVRAAAEEGTNAKAEWYDAGKQTRTLFRQLLDSGHTYTTSVLKPQLLRASRGFAALYPAAGPTRGAGVKFLQADWVAWDTAVKGIPQQASGARDELRAKLEADRALLGEANESSGDALFCRLLRSFGTGSATDRGECPPPAQVTGERSPAGSRAAFVGAETVPSQASQSTPWDHREVVRVEGRHLHLGRAYVCTNKNFSTPNRSVQFEWSQEELKKDKDTFWEFHRYTPRSIEWSVCAQNCTWSCDEVRLRIEWRLVPVRASPPSQLVPPSPSQKSSAPHSRRAPRGARRRHRHGRDARV